MNRSLFRCFYRLIFLPFFCLPLVANAEGYLRTAEPLDEPRGYCLDVAGFGVNARPEEPLRVHTCKYGEDNVDQIFKWVDYDSGHFIMPAYNRCLAVGSMQAGAQILTADCEQSTLQAWDMVPNGQFSLRARPELCLTIGPERFDAGAEILVFPGYGYRTSTLEFCRDPGDPLQKFRWGLEAEHERELANGLRSTMPESIHQTLAEWARNDEGSVAQTNELYASEPKTYRPSEVATTLDISYGTHNRHKLDVHVDTQRRGTDLQPVIMYFHGGGYTRGAKENSHNVGEYFASIGLVGVSATYRLAPEINWPDGANDIGAAIQWVYDNIEQYGGDPNRIFVIGKSAGGGHVANYAFRPEVLNTQYPLAAGVILVSASYGADTPAYFGSSFGNDPEEQQLSGNISRTSIPVLLITSEYDWEELHTSALQIAYELGVEQGSMPRIRQLQGHNHYSSNNSIGTSDRMLSDEILDFVLNTAP